MHDNRRTASSAFRLIASLSRCFALRHADRTEPLRLYLQDAASALSLSTFSKRHSHFERIPVQSTIISTARIFDAYVDLEVNPWIVERLEISQR